MAPTRAEILGFIASHEPLEKTLARFPGVTREHLRALLREAALAMQLEEEGLAPEVSPAKLEPVLEAPPETITAAPQTRPEAGPRRLLRLFTDGAARGNPGPAGAGAVLTKEDGSVVARCGKFLGSQTNNYAEYMGLLLGLEAALKLGANELQLFADSELMVRQLNGVYKVRNPGLRPLFEQAKKLLGQFRKVRIEHVPREQNALADEMSNRAIDERL